LNGGRPLVNKGFDGGRVSDVGNALGRPGGHARPARPDPDAYLGWLARTHRYDAEDAGLATATVFARRLAELPGASAIGPAMISRLEGGTAAWRVEHLTSYARALGIPPARLLAPAYKVGKAFGRRGVGGLLAARYTDDDEQAAADVVDAACGDDPVSAADWDLLSGYLVVSRRKLGMRTWARLCERLLLEICATQGAGQDIRAEALIRLATLERAGAAATAAAVGTAEQAGNPMSFMPLKVFQRLPRKAPHGWVVAALLNPPDRWLLRELFSCVAVLVATGEWQPSTRQLAALRRHSAGATLDAEMEMEVRRASMQLLRTLDPGAARRILPRTGDVELVYLGKADGGTDPQRARYGALAARLAAEIQDGGLRRQGKWAAGEDPVLAEVLVQSLFGRDGPARGACTTLLVNSGYARALRAALAGRLDDTATYRDAAVARSLVRLFGKVASGERDGRAILRMIDGERLDVDTRVQACWALANAAPRLPPHVVRAGVHACRHRPFGVQAVTALRAGIASCGRAGLTGPLRTLLDDRTVAPSARRECAWWLSLPRGVLASVRTDA
jgi:hypothetical protein